jgi:sec-independent protein translocase protein TatA
MGLDNPIHIAFLLIVLLLVFGAKRLPELGHSLGSGLRGFKEAIGGEGAHSALSATVQEQSRPRAHVGVQPGAPVTSAPDITGAVAGAPLTSSVASAPDDRAA